jgi:hypothetical protein
MNITKPRLDQFKITGSTVGDVHFPKVKWLSPFDGSNGATTTTDSSDSNSSLTLQGSTQISTAQSKFGGSSMYVPSSTEQGVYANVAGTTVNLTGDFTLEWWIYRVQVSYANNMAQLIYGMPLSSSLSGYAMVVGYYGSSTSTTQSLMYVSSNGSSWNVASAVQLGTGSLGTVGQWVHMALVRSGSDWSYYVDGTRTYTASLGSATIATPGSYMYLGRAWGSDNSIEAYYDDFRVTQGLARYSGASFTVPTTAHLTSAGDVNKHIVVNSDADGVAIGTGGISQARIAKAWVNFVGTNGSINSSYNVSSITDNTTGSFTVNFSTAMNGATDYCCVAMAEYNSSNGSGMHVYGANSQGSSLPTASAFRIDVLNYNNTNDGDCGPVHLLFFGN